MTLKPLLFLSIHYHLFPENRLNKTSDSRVWLRIKVPMWHLVEHQDWELLLPLQRGFLALDAQWFVWWHDHWLLARHDVSEDTIVKTIQLEVSSIWLKSWDHLLSSDRKNPMLSLHIHQLLVQWLCGIRFVAKLVASTRQGHCLQRLLVQLLILRCPKVWKSL